MNQKPPKSEFPLGISKCSIERYSVGTAPDSAGHSADANPVPAALGASPLWNQSRAPSACTLALFAILVAFNNLCANNLLHMCASTTKLTLELRWIFIG